MLKSIYLNVLTLGLFLWLHNSNMMQHVRVDNNLVIVVVLVITLGTIVIIQG